MRPPAASVRLAILFSLLGAAGSPFRTAAAVPPPPSVAGLWDARIQNGAVEVPFRFGIAVHGSQVSGWFFNGNEKVVSTGGTLDSTHLTLEFPSYARRLDVTLHDGGALSGTYAPTAPGSTAPTFPFEARRSTGTTSAAADGTVPHIEGTWLLPAQSRKANEHAWRFIVRQSGPDVSAAILRVDGDTGALTGRWHDGKLLLSHFDGARPALVEVTAEGDGTLLIRLHDSHGADVTLTGYRNDDARAKGLPEAADPTRHTTVADGRSPFRFSFPNLDGQNVSNTDARFGGKVLIVDVSGSWCPNCHDEAPFLQGLYRKYRSRGLEVITLSFEEPEQLANPERLRAFIRAYGIEYTVLLAGTTQELHTKLPQAVDLDAYPTTFFIGRDGLVRSIHAGFAAPATGDYNVRLKQDFTSQIEQLLGERAPPRVAAAVATQ